MDTSKRPEGKGIESGTPSFRHRLAALRSVLPRCRNDLNLEQLRPQLAGDEQAIVRGVIRNAVQHRSRRALFLLRKDAGEIDPPQHFAGGRGDARDSIRMPDIRVDLALYVLQLVEFLNRF